MKKFVFLTILLIIFAGCASISDNDIRCINNSSDLVGYPSEIHIILDSKDTIIESGTEEYDEILDLVKGRFPEKMQQAQIAVLWADKNGLNRDMMCEQFDYLQFLYKAPQTVTMDFKKESDADHTITFEELIFPLSEHADIVCVETEQVGIRCYGPLQQECMEMLRSYAK